MTAAKLATILAWLSSPPLIAPKAKVTELAANDLPDLHGRQGLMMTMEYPPGGGGPIHGYYANTFIYVLEGTVSMQDKSGKVTTLAPGQGFYEAPALVPVRVWNASRTQPVKVVLFLVRNQDAPVLMGAN